MSSTQAAGSQGRVYWEPGSGPHTFDTNSESWPIVSESFRKVETITRGNGLSGTRSQHVSQTRRTQAAVSGTINLNPTPNMLDWLLTYMTGDTEDTDVWTLDTSTETLPEFGVLIDREGGTFEYTDCKVSRFNLSGRAGGLLELQLDIIAKTEVTGTSAPSVAFGTNEILDAPYQFADCVFSLESSARNFNSFAFSVDNQITPIFYNSTTATHLLETGRLVRFGGDVQFNSTTLAALYGTGDNGAGASIVATNGGAEFTVAMTSLQLPDQSPLMSGPGATFLPVVGEVRGASSTLYEAFFDNDVTI